MSIPGNHLRDNSHMSPRRAKLDALIEAAKDHVMTPREKWLQRVSFVYGNAMGNPNITRAMVERRAVEVYGPCPEE